MSKPVTLDAAAEEELAAAEAWYEERAGLGGDFLAAVRESNHDIARRTPVELLSVRWDQRVTQTIRTRFLGERAEPRSEP